MEGLDLDLEPPALGHLADSSDDEPAGSPSRQARDKKRLRAEKRARKEEKRAKREKKDEKRRKEAVDAMMELSGEGAGAQAGKGKGKERKAVAEEAVAEPAPAGESSSRKKEKRAKKVKEAKAPSKERPTKKVKKRKRAEDDEDEGQEEPPLVSRSPTPPPPPRRKAPATPITYQRKDRTRSSHSERGSSPEATTGGQLSGSTRKTKAATAKVKTPTKAKAKSSARAPAPTAPSSPDSSALNPADDASGSASNDAANPFSRAKRQRLDSGGARSDSREDAASLRLRFQTPGAMEDWIACQFVNRKVLVELENEGVLTYKKGKLSAPEVALVRKAVNNYARINRMNQDEVTDRIMLETKTAANKEETRDLWLAIAAATPGRPICVLQPVVRRMYDPRGHKGQWTAEEDRQLLRAYDLTPGQWKTIASVVDRSESDCRDRYSKELAFKEGQHTGRWSADEEKRLREIVWRIVKDQQASRDGGPAKGSEEDDEAEAEVDEKEIPWTAVGQEMGTRSTTQCRIKWRDTFGKSKSARSATGVWNGGDSKERTLRVIKRLQALEYRSEKHINWGVVRDDTLEHVSAKDVRNAYSNCRKQILSHLDQEKIAFKDLLRLMREYVEERIAVKKPQQMSKDMINDSDDE